MPRQFKEKMWTVKQPKVGVWESYGDNGVLMAVKQGTGNGNFVSAPNGFMDVNGVWYRWDVNNHELGQGIMEWNAGVKPEVQEIAKMVLEATKTETIPGEASMWSSEFGNAGMDVRPEKSVEMHKQFLRAIFSSVMTPKDLWTRQGYSGSEIFDDFYNWAMTTSSVNLQMLVPTAWSMHTKVKSLGMVDIKSQQDMFFLSEEYMNSPMVKAVGRYCDTEWRFFYGI